MIQIFYDDMGTVNPLHGNSKLHNVESFYYTIKNLPSAFNSCFANVHLLALCYAHDHKVYGFDPIQQKLVTEMKHLGNTGFSGMFPIIGERQIFVGVCHFACDNLALNSIFGFIESFSCDYLCTLCLAKLDEIS